MSNIPPKPTKEAKVQLADKTKAMNTGSVITKTKDGYFWPVCDADKLPTKKS